jgi:hypothetical protein
MFASHRILRVEPRKFSTFPLTHFSGTMKSMKKSIHGTRKSRGRPKTTGAGIQIGMRWQPEELATIDGWRRKQEDLPSRTVAIRRLVQLGLKRRQQF